MDRNCAASDGLTNGSSWIEVSPTPSPRVGPDHRVQFQDCWDDTIRIAPLQLHIDEGQSLLGMVQTAALVVDMTSEESADCRLSS